MVNALYKSDLNQDYNFKWLATQDDRGSIRNLLTFVLAWLAAPWMMLSADLVHIHTASYTSFFRKSFFMLWCIILRKKYIAHIHGGGFPEFMRKSHGIKKRYRVWLLKHASAIITLAEIFEKTVQSYLPSSGKRKYFILPNPGRFDLQKPHIFTPQVNIFYCGWLEKEKGIFDLLQAFARSRQPDWRLIMVGKGKHEELKKQAAGLGIANAVELRQWQNADELSELYGSSTLLVLPSYIEAMPMVLLEAMAFGLPIIASSVGAIPDMLPESQQDCLLTPGDVEKLSKLLADLAGNNIRLQQISSELQQRFAGKFSAAEVFKQQKMIYETLLSGSSN